MQNMPSITSVIISSNNLILHATLAIILSLLFTFLKIPSLILYGLHTYIHPDDVNPNSNKSSSGIRAAIRRPGGIESDQLKPRKKSKERFEFDENKAQIFRLKLSEGHLESRFFFSAYYGAFNSTFIALFSLLLHRFLKVDKDSGSVKNGTIIPILLGLVAVFRLTLLIAKTGYEKSASKKLDKQLSLVWGVSGFVLGLNFVFGVIPKWVLEFGFEESLDGLGKFFLAVLMGCIAGSLYIPALRNARAFWLGTDQIRCNLSIISCGWFSRALIYTNYALVMFASLLWINPFVESLVDASFEIHRLRVWCLLATGLLQFLALRSNVQMFLNEAVLCWYQRLHASKVPDLDYSRAKVFLHNHYICLVVLQSFAPAALVLLLLGFSQFDDSVLTSLVDDVSRYSPLVREAILFLAWWMTFVSAVFSTVILALYRRGILYVS